MKMEFQDDKFLLSTDKKIYTQNSVLCKFNTHKLPRPRQIYWDYNYRNFVIIERGTYYTIN